MIKKREIISFLLLLAAWTFVLLALNPALSTWGKASGIVCIVALGTLYFTGAVLLRQATRGRIVLSVALAVVLLVVCWLVEGMAVKDFFLDRYYKKYTLCQALVMGSHYTYLWTAFGAVCLLVYLRSKAGRFIKAFTWALFGLMIAGAASSFFAVDATQFISYAKVFRENVPDRVIVLADEQTFELQTFVRDTAFAGKTKVVYYWTPGCESLGDIEYINALADRYPGMAQIFIASQNRRCDRYRWRRDIEDSDLRGYHLFIRRADMERIYFDELGLDGMPGVAVFSADNEIVFKGHMREGDFLSGKRIDLEQYIR